jgi:hypothetical protein
MAQNRTSGFDILVQISEAELNAQAAEAFAGGALFPPSLSSPVNAFGLQGSLDLNFGVPVIDLDRPRPQIGISVPFFNSQLAITSPLATTIAPLGGTMVIVDAVQMRSSANTQQAVIDFVAGAPTVTVVFDAATVALLTPILAGFGMSVAVAQNQLAGVVRDRLVSDVQRLPLTPAIAVGNDDDPITPSSIEVTTVNDSSALDRDCLVFGVRTDAASGGNIAAVTQSFIPAGSPALLMLSNNWLLAQVVRPKLASALGAQTSDFDTPLRLNHPIGTSGGHHATITDLEAHIEGNRIRCNGRATASDTGWSAVSTFSFFIDLGLNNGQIVITSSTPQVHTEVSLEWWVWLLSLGLGGLFGGVVGLIVGAIVPAVVEAVAEGMADKLQSNAISNAVSGIPPVPLGPIGSGLTLASLVLDDLELRGPVQRSLGLCVKSSGEVAMVGGFTLDLDTGNVRSMGSHQASLDLKWDPSIGLDALNGTRWGITGQPYGALTPLALRQMFMLGSHVGAAAIPQSIDLPLLGWHHEMVMGVRTNEGRLAKLRVWRDLLHGDALQLHWTTYDTPIPVLDIVTRWEVTARGDSMGFISKDFASCRRDTVSRRCVVEAWPRLMAFPVNYQWCLCGTVLEAPSGSVSHAGGTLKYTLNGRDLVLEGGMGDTLDCELCVSAIDNQGRELFTCVQLKQDQYDVTCGKGRVFYPKPKYTVIPCDPLRAIAQWEAVGSPAVQLQLAQAMQVGQKAELAAAAGLTDAKQSLAGRLG